MADAECDGSQRRRAPRDVVSESGEAEREGIQRQPFRDAAVDSRPVIYSDIRHFPAARYQGATLLTGGFPCQPFSQAGKRRGKEDDRYLWPEMLRVISETRPAWVLGENVVGLVTMELDRVLSDLEGESYSCQSLIIPACAVDAKHRRDRVWIVGHAEQQVDGRRDARESKRQIQQFGIGDGERNISNVNSESPGRVTESWLPEPEFCGMADGVPEGLDGGKGFCSWEEEWEAVPRVATRIKNRLDRLKGLGNSVVPALVHEILKVIADLERISR